MAGAHFSWALDSSGPKSDWALALGLDRVWIVIWAWALSCRKLGPTGSWANIFKSPKELGLVKAQTNSIFLFFFSPSHPSFYFLHPNGRIDFSFPFLLFFFFSFSFSPFPPELHPIHSLSFSFLLFAVRFFLLQLIFFFFLPSFTFLLSFFFLFLLLLLLLAVPFSLIDLFSFFLLSFLHWFFFSLLQPIQPVGFFFLNLLHLFLPFIFQFLSSSGLLFLSLSIFLRFLPCLLLFLGSEPSSRWDRWRESTVWLERATTARAALNSGWAFFIFFFRFLFSHLSSVSSLFLSRAGMAWWWN